MSNKSPMLLITLFARVLMLALPVCLTIKQMLRVQILCSMKAMAVTLLLAFCQISAWKAHADEQLGQPLPTLAPLIERVTPAVVNISTRGPMPARNPLMDDPFFQRFFGLQDPATETPPRSLGSGVIVDAEDGLVVTNHHVIAEASQIFVTLADGREFEATLQGSDPEADIAVISITANNLRALPWADSQQVRVGDYCVAIGNPFGLGQTVTSGIVSALERSGLGIGGFENFIQTDASINPGNSGGALVNLRGELIGINTAILGPSGGNVGIGFAIPSNMASDLVAQLLEFGEVRRGALGIAAQPLTASLAEAFNVPGGYGVIIGAVQESSPAAEAGILPGDVITAIDGRPVRDVKAVRNRIGLVRVGQQIELAIIRDGRERTVEVTVAELRERNPLLAGATLGERSSQNGRRFVVVERVVPGSQLAEAGIDIGDIILSINRQGVGTIRDVREIVRASDDEILILIQRGRATYYVNLRKE